MRNLSAQRNRIMMMLQIEEEEEECEKEDSVNIGSCAYVHKYVALTGDLSSS